MGPAGPVGPEGLRGADGRPAILALYSVGQFQEVRFNRQSAAETWFRMAGRLVSWNSTTNNAKLRITYQDTLGAHAGVINACRWRILLDGIQLEHFSKDIDGTTGWHIDNSTHTVWAYNVPAGSHEVVVEVQRAGNANECIAGWNTSGNFLSVEELP
jgi:hypothetical protein